ncbi:amino acid adenylation domain-containing protein [Tenacibaculum sp. 190524A02b]|uniref:amino acid adenylation domain-containing protein n=1 Tax=Tenacibaculum vairaonense TaxID=3137860 RepID=UPI0031FB6AA9
MELIKKLGELGIQLIKDNNDLKIKAPKGTLTKELVTQIKEEKEDLLMLMSRSIDSNNVIPNFPPRPYYPLSSSQQRLWVLSQFEGGNKAYNIPGVFEMEGNLNVEVLQQSFQYLLKRHESLRTRFVEIEGGVYQEVINEDALAFTIENKKVIKEDVKEIITSFYEEKFDLSQAPLLKSQLLQTGEDSYYLLFAIHHIIGDGWSMEVFTKELMYVYNQLLNKENIDLPTLRIQYKDYTLWLESDESQERLTIQGSYWQNKLAGELPVLELPSYKKRPLVKSYHGATKLYNFSKSFSDKLKTFNQSQGVTLYMSLLSGINGLFYRYTGLTDILLGGPIAGRSHSDLANQIGLYLNTLAIRTRFEGDDSFISLLAKQKVTLLEAYEHQEYPFSSIVDELGLQRDTSRSALFDVLVVLQNQQETAITLKDVNISPYNEVSRQVSQFDMTFSFSEVDSRLCLRLEYNTDIYETFQIDELCEHLERFIESGIDFPNEKISNLGYLTSEEEHELLYDFNDTDVDYPSNKTLVDLFREQVAKNPEAIAIVYENKQITYQELDSLSNAMANYILDNNVVNDSIIGIQLERSEWIVISMLAILKAGAAYLSIDPNFPDKRINFIIQDSKCDIVINSSFIKEFELQVKNTFAPNIKVTPNYLAYVIYTSGSTGNPKGVMVEHRNIVNFLFDYQLDIHNTSLTCKTIFDVSVFEIIGTVTSGSTLFIPEEKTIYNPKKYADFLYKNKITHCYIHPMFLEGIAEQLAIYDEVYLKQILIGVEAIKPSSIQWYFKNDVKIINAYGPTECTICATKYKVDSLEEIKTPNIPIGTPLKNYQVYIVNETINQLQPKGVIGELCISGKGVARGYLNNLSLTQEKFIAHPFIKGKRMYRTGDLARRLPNGVIEFIGRKDTQVKIRGHRIELGEIENTLISLKQILQAVVIVEKKSSVEYLVGYLVSRTTLNIKSIKESLKEFLPDYMIPNYFVQIDEIPVTPNGKIARTALPKVNLDEILEDEYLAPENKIQEKLVIIWEKILRIKKIGINKSFFEVGGNSLHLIQLNSKIKEVFNVELQLSDIIMNMDIQSLAVKIASKEKTLISIQKINLEENIPLTPLQEKIWYTCQVKSRKTSYNMVMTLQNIPNFTYELFTKNVQDFIQKHRILRAFFKYDKGKLTQSIVPSLNIEQVLNRIELSGTNEVIQERICQVEENEKTYEFNLEHPGLFRINIVTSGKTNAIIFNIHHIIADRVTLEILKKELLEPFSEVIKENKIDFLDYVSWMHNQLGTEKGNKLKNKVAKLFENVEKVELPIVKKQLKNTEFTPRIAEVKMSFLEKEKIVNTCKELNVTPFSFWVFVWGTTLSLLAEKQTVIVSSPVNTRFHQTLKNQPGLFLNTLQIPIEISKDKLIKQAIQDNFQDIIESIDNNLPTEFFLSSEVKKTLDQYFIIYNEVEESSSENKIQENDLGKFSLALIVTKKAHKYLGAIQYDAAKYLKTDIDLLAIRFTNICNQIITKKTSNVHELSVLLETEKQLTNIKSEFIF